MNRRRFLEAAAGALAVGATQSALAGQAPPPRRRPLLPARLRPGPAWSKKNAFKLKYAPHIGMFKESAGPNPARAAPFHGRQRLHGLRGQRHDGAVPVELQQQMGDLMAKLGITMGVFVVQTGGNGSSNFTSGKPEDAGNFVKACTAAVDDRQAVQRQVDDRRARQLRSPPADSTCRPRTSSTRCAPAPTCWRKRTW